RRRPNRKSKLSWPGRDCSRFGHPIQSATIMFDREVGMSQFPMNRRSALALMGGAAALSLTSLKARAAGELKVLNWQGYGTDEKWALDIFKQKTGLDVVHDYFNSEQEMLTKLRTSPGTYDVVLVNNIYVMDAANEGLIQPIDTSKITNFGDLTPALRDSPRFVKDGKYYG